MKNFGFYLPTKVFFGKKVLRQFPKEIPSLGKKALWVFGRSSIMRNGVYEQVKEVLKKAKIEYVEFGGVKANPLLSKVLEGIKVAKEEGVSFILATGGGSVIDTAKAIACGVFAEEKIWDFYERKAFPTEALPIVAIPTISGTGSELNNISVIVNDETKVKLSMSSPFIFPKLTFLDPTFTFSVPPDYTAYGAFDAFSHVFEVFVSREYKKDCLTEDLMVALMKNIMRWSKVAMYDPTNYEARANLMWASSLALCGLPKAGVGKYRFFIHALEHTLSGVYDLPHGLGLAVITYAWMKVHKKNKLLHKFFEKVLGIKVEDKISVEMGIEVFENWLRDLRLLYTLKDLKIPKEDLDYLVDKAYHILTIWEVAEEISKEDIRGIFHLAYYEEKNL
ncbi:iron-containing alcohol dehydrogenase [Thermodesulfobacterium sp. TA1]|uniref:iron-containing alcohol dehydrogenase n=1 Tax=Thermodesulfobacterium sp. TA1 TaxID=2234087 RepID=UPI00143D672B|nr:iron-containing alcohol dehydrogenase [Thermodesulfobacterium sp. TA1]